MLAELENISGTMSRHLDIIRDFLDIIVAESVVLLAKWPRVYLPESGCPVRWRHPNYPIKLV